ncbi:hypothetical protein L873DRAFT_1797449 [Choiromyces venosus 120613-1]|uniref:Uncharacterized protein n=1 Tax=Choiromyces venosus 120613-1 TaxID=1336337 RepID=A0A3N4K8P0_9PEZI|nr:hypothetical protein L873DRAFT_1797449 [Choiromyces venosus 120613-1]
MRFSKLTIVALLSGLVHSCPEDAILIPKLGGSEILSQADAIDLCKSREFDLVVENWFVSEATEWLHEYTKKKKDTYNYKKRGIIGAIAYDYLGDSGMVCGTNTASLCHVDCVNLVKSIPDVLEAQKIYFILKSAQHLNLVFDTVRKDLTAAQANVALMAPSISSALHWSEKDDYEQTQKLLIGYLNVFIQMVIASATAWVPGSSILAFAEESWRMAQVNVAALEEHLREVELTNYYQVVADQVLQAQRETTRRRELVDRLIKNGEKKSWADQRWYKAASPWVGVMAPQMAFDYIGKFTSFEGAEGSAQRNQEKLMLYLKGTGEFTRRRLGDGVDELFKGLEADDEGATSFSKLVGSGGYLPSTSEALSLWTGAEVEEKLTRNFMLKALDATLRSQEIWITCTKDFKTVKPRADSTSKAKYPTNMCQKDMSGPQDLKECVDGNVCYMYKWQSRYLPYQRHNVEKLYGMDTLLDAPYSLDPKDIIHSSVKTYLEQHNKDAALPGTLSLASFKDAASAEKIWDSRQAGLFTVPVCMSQYNFNTPLEPFNAFTCSLNPDCRQKTLPCNCGPYGSETKTVWKEAGLWDLPSAANYRQVLCSRQIAARITDDLEKYTAHCNVEVHGQVLTWKKDGANTMCGPIMEQLESVGYPCKEDMSPTFNTRMLCLAGKISRKKCARFGDLMATE